MLLLFVRRFASKTSNKHLKKVPTSKLTGHRPKPTVRTGAVKEDESILWTSDEEAKRVAKNALDSESLSLGSLGTGIFFRKRCR